MKDTVLKEIFELPPAERIRLAKVILESITDGPELTERQRTFIEERLAYEEENPHATITLKEIKASLKRRSASKG
jgi:putative addiction module component (TIGR02574 family)